MKRLQPDFSDSYNLFNYSYEFLEPYFYQRPVAYPVPSQYKNTASRKGKTRGWYSRVVSNEYGVKGSVQENSMYNAEIAPYSVRVIEYQDCEFGSVVLYFYSIDDASISVILPATEDRPVVVLKEAVYVYLATYSQLQTRKVFEDYFLDVTKDAQFNYN